MRPPVRFVARLERSRRHVLVATGVLLAACAVSLTRLEIEMDLLEQLPSSSTVFRDYREVLGRFGTTDTLVILVSGPPEAIRPFGDALAERLRAVPGVSSVRTGVDARVLRTDWIARHRWQLLDEPGYDEVARLLEPAAIRDRVAGLKLALALPGAAGVGHEIAIDPLGIDSLVLRAIGTRYGDSLFGSFASSAGPSAPRDGTFLSRDGRSRLLLVRPERSPFDTVFGRRLLDRVTREEQGLLEGEWLGRGVSVRHTGALVYALGDRSVLERDLSLYFVIAPLAVLALFHAGVRTLKILPFVTVPLLVTTAVTFALSLTLFGRLTMISVAFAGIFYGLAVDSAIYFYATLRTHAVTDADSLRSAIASTLAEIGPANLVATATTAAAFFVVGLSGFDGIAQLGTLTGAAMLLNVIATFVLLPSMTLWWGPSSVPGRAPSRVWGTLLAERASRLPRTALGVGIVGAALLGLPRLTLDADLSNLHPGSPEAQETELRIAEAFGNLRGAASVVVRGADQAEALAKADRVSRAIQELKEGGVADSWATITAFVPAPEVIDRRLERWRALPRGEARGALEAALAAEGFELEPFSAFLSSLTDAPPPLDLAAPVLGSIRERHLHEDERGVWVATSFASEHLADAAQALRGRLSGIDAHILGQELVEDELHRLMRREVAIFVAAALVLNLFFLLVFARAGRAAFELLFPAGAALVTTLGLMGLAGVALDPINVVALPVILGLGVDATVYLSAHGPERGVRPLLLASGTTFLGFGLLALSHFPALAGLGAVSGVGLVLSTLFTLAFVPAREKLR